MPTPQTIRHKLHAKKGFTLIELLVVIAIIGILATFVVASFSSAQQRGRDSRRKADLDAIKKALELFKNDTRGSSYYTGALGACNTAGNLATYIKLIPCDPSTVASYLYTPGSPVGACTPANVTVATADCTDYRLRAVLENKNDSQAANGGSGASIILGSATRCPTAYGTTYTTDTYVICPD